MKSCFLIAASLFSLGMVAQAQTPKLLKDINSLRPAAHSNPSSMTSESWSREWGFSRLGNKILLSAYTVSTNQELWTSDGTAAGTRLLKQIGPGLWAGKPRNLQVTNDGKRAFFVADDRVTDGVLWVTDGTTVGTRKVIQVSVGVIVAFGKSSVIFTGPLSQGGMEINISDGTFKGTRRLKYIRPGRSTWIPVQLCPTKDGKKVFFTADNGVNGPELWVTDGTSQGTRMVRDIQTSRRSKSLFYPVPLGTSKVVFSIDDGKSGTELWVTDGTSKGTSLVADLYKGKSSGATTLHAIAMGNKVIFSGYSPGSGFEPFVTDGTAKGTIRLIDAFVGAGSGNLYHPRLDSSGKKVYWTSLRSVGDTRIYVSDGTPAGTKMFSPKNITPDKTWPPAVLESQGKVYFLSRNLTPGTGLELCVSDGTVAGTKTLRDTWKGARDGGAGYLTRFGANDIFYVADDGIAGRQLWKLTFGKSFLRLDINKPKPGHTRSSYPTGIARFGSRVIFSATGDETGSATWESTGLASGTKVLKQIDLSGSYNKTGIYAAAGDKLVFDAYTPQTGVELFVTDGTSAGTRLLKDIRPGTASSSPKELTSIGGKAWFVCPLRSGEWELWVTDGTQAGTLRIKILHYSGAGRNRRFFAGRGDKVVFLSHSTLQGSELWISDGTEAGTKVLKDINPGRGNSYASYMTFNAGKVYFTAYTPATGYELWVTDFTSKGTVLVKDIAPGTASSDPADLTARNGRFFFRAVTAATGAEIFVSDGTSAGTKLFLDYRPGRLAWYPSWLTAVGSRKVYFASRTPAQGVETLVTDGTRAGTRVFDINPGLGSGVGIFGYPTHRVALGSQVFFPGRHPLLGIEVFTVDNGATAEPLGTPYHSTWIHGSDPVLGKTATIMGGTELGNAVHVTLFGSQSPRPTRIGAAGFAHFDLTRYFGIAGVTQGKGFQHALAVPNNPAFKGVQLVFQTLAFDAKNLAGTLELSNGLHWTVGL